MLAQLSYVPWKVIKILIAELKNHAVVQRMNWKSDKYACMLIVTIHNQVTTQSAQQTLIIVILNLHAKILRLKICRFVIWMPVKCARQLMKNNSSVFLLVLVFQHQKTKGCV